MLLNERVCGKIDFLWMNIKGEKNPWGNFRSHLFLLSLLLLCMLMYEIVYNVKEEIDGLMGIFICKLLVLYKQGNKQRISEYDKSKVKLRILNQSVFRNIIE